jgi:cation diffusion facilitator CzcD-associated flavoprotein CzcO
MADKQSKTPSQPGRFDAVVVGAGFAGLYQLYRLRQLGLRTCVLEAGDGVGGTWYWNRYPGARCDIPSVDYSYSFSAELEQGWEWSEKYATQPEILRYLEHVADLFDLRRDIRLEERVLTATFDERTACWSVQTSSGLQLQTRFLIMATGCLSTSRIPDIPGRGDFAGDSFHTAEWPHHGVDLRSKRVGVIGTGSSGVQIIPELAEHAAQVTVFQRTPGFCMPAHNRPLTDEERRRAKELAPRRQQIARASSFGMDIPNPEHRALEVEDSDREATYERHWNDGAVMPLMLSYRDLMTNREANATVAEFLRRKIFEIVRDPATARALTPRGFPFGAKRTTVGTRYPDVFNLAHVHLVDVRADPIERITTTGVQTASGEHPLDALVFATGFDAMTGALTAIDIRGWDGRRLTDKWSSGPQTYLGLATNGFPNMFIIAGPGSPSVLSNAVISIEQHVDWVADCIGYLREHRHTTIEATAAAEQAWVEEVNASAASTLYPEGNSWYLGGNVPGKPRVFMPYTRGVAAYARICNEVAANRYRGFVMGPSQITKTEEGDRNSAVLPERPAS